MLAYQVVLAEAGIFVPHARVTAGKLRGALDRAIRRRIHTSAAERIQASFQAAGGPAAAADRLEALLPS
jgi:UDP:flavonoid glycosyltransferase YjiC (YdhE family)